MTFAPSLGLHAKRLIAFVACPNVATAQDGTLNAGVVSVDITPTEPVVLAGSPSRLVSTSIKYRLYARALVLSDGKQKIAIDLKEQSPFKHTMTVEQANGAHGNVPNAKAFEGGSYETWFGEHSYLTVQATKIIQRESMETLKRLKQEN